MLDGTLVRHTYEGTINGKPRHGEETIAYSSMAKRFQISWVDDFHMRGGILFSEGEATERGFTVKGKILCSGWSTLGLEVAGTISQLVGSAP